MQPQSSGKFRPRLNTGEGMISNKYREGNMKRTLRRVSKSSSLAKLWYGDDLDRWSALRSDSKFLMRLSHLSRIRFGDSVPGWVVAGGGRAEDSSVTLSTQKDVMLGEAFRGIAAARRGTSTIIRKCVLVVTASHGRSEASSVTSPAWKDVVLGEALRGTTSARWGANQIIRK
ncbi:hypothetical protein TanjilG_20554 [Lupinus angustifolius]|uniref:Uncharacterized protein n=1 Tax=Lupinus angustifolius TaxID=3871 RepID=A0A1J7G581_LUPAN|nr:hypothetical protein TanjilG_20554 [Lupinus angustifolius]